LPKQDSTIRSGLQERVETFQYPDSPVPPSLAWGGWSAPETPEPAVEPVKEPVHEATHVAHAAVAAGLKAEWEQKVVEEAKRAFEAGREKGRQEGREAEREAQAGAAAAAEQRRTHQVGELIERFGQERDRYLHNVEHEVVELALAIAARILRREAQMDPLLLTGAVRVALGQLSGSTKVRLRVPPAELDLWTETIALLPNLATKPAVVPGEGMRLGDCVIETEMGSVDLGIRAQLGEIERGFFDRAGGSRNEPGAAPDGPIQAGHEGRP
jgi:flagellar assembly protein FliH